MLRMRRGRVVLACTCLFLFLLYRVAVNSAWDGDLEYNYVGAVIPDVGRRPPPAQGGELTQNPIQGGHQLPPGGEKAKAQDKIKLPELKPDVDATGDKLSLSQPDVVAADDAPATTPPPAVPVREPGRVGDAFLANDAEKPLHPQNPPGRLEPEVTYTPPIHWTKLPEHFPVDSLIPLPTGKPSSIPTIQAKFGAEPDEAKAKRETRQAQIKTEMKRAWDAYRTYAFGHDELIPIARGSKNPFAGWGATLVDSLDTLWIMGLKEEFDDAYNALKQIDFTTTHRTEIPVFETTIRYLGGFLAAYDVTGGHKGKYPMLLEKAVELAEILMGVFDTPNRMPILYYNWRPAYVSQPKRAAVRSGVAEMGTLSMEFTRLAQLTGKDKYYDAVARIDDAMHEFQNREGHTAPLLSGIFPENIDASGCNRTATELRAIEAASPQAQEQAAAAGTPDGPQGYGPPKKAPGPEVELRDDGRLDPAGASKKPGKRDVAPPTVPKGSPADTHWSSSYRAGSGSSRGPPANQQPLGANGLPANWDCVPQNLTASVGMQQYGMGGSQDSAYEYFPKQYLLLGGLEGKYQSMYEQTVAAVKKWLLFRPMVRDDADILFSAKAKVTTDDKLDLSKRVRLEYEVTHLTCFIGGMFALGGKIFGSDEDVEYGRRLTDGCVWAYSSMPAGIMAEYAQITPCADAGQCSWNETAWHLFMDPQPEWREKSMEDWHVRVADWEVEKRKVLRAEAERQEVEAEMARRAKLVTDPTQPRTTSTGVEPGVPAGYGGPSSSKSGVPRRDDNVETPPAHRKRDVDPVTGDTLALDISTLDQNAVEEKVKKLEAAFGSGDVILGTSFATGPGSQEAFGGLTGQVSIDPVLAKAQDNPAFRLPYKPKKPPTHMEYVNERIESQSLPEGYTAIGSNAYQLRSVELSLLLSFPFDLPLGEPDGS